MIDTYFACCQITFVRCVSLYSLHAWQNVKDVHNSTHCDLLSWLYLQIHPSMSMSVFSILLFRVPASHTALLQSRTLHTLSRIMCHMCETLGPGSTFQEQKELQRASERERMFIPLCAFHSILRGFFVRSAAFPIFIVPALPECLCLHVIVCKSCLFRF